MAYWQIYTIVRPQDSVRACENTVTLNTEHSDVAQSLPSLIVMTFPAEVEFKKMTPILRDFCLSGLKRVFVVLCKFQVVLDACPLAQGVTLVRKPRLTGSRCWTSNLVSLQKRRPNASTDDRPSTRKLLFSFR